METIRDTRLAIYKRYIGKNITIYFKCRYTQVCYKYSHDEFVEYLKNNPQCTVFTSKSWVDEEYYNWYKPPYQKYGDFLKKCVIDKIPSNLDMPSTRTLSIDAIAQYKKQNGHCYIYSSDNENLYNYVTQKRYQFNSDTLSDNEIEKLKQLGFIFNTELGHYFKPENKLDRKYLIKVLGEIK